LELRKRSRNLWFENPLFGRDPLDRDIKLIVGQAVEKQRVESNADTRPLYLMGGFASEKELLKKLGKYKTSVGCLYIKKLDDVDKKVLKALVIASVKKMKSQDKK